jgi:hypothetical protein
MAKTENMAMAGVQGYDPHTGNDSKHSDPSASKEGARRWMKAVATMTPDPKYLTPENIHSGTPARFDEVEVSLAGSADLTHASSQLLKTHVSAGTA